MSSSCSFDTQETRMNNLCLGIHIPTFILGLLLNLLAIHRFSNFLRSPNHTATSIYMINLAVFDLLQVLSLAFRMTLSTNCWPMVYCTMAECLYYISMYGSIFTICFISLDRFLAVQFPFLTIHLRSPKKIFCICCVIWVLVWVGSIPIYNFHEQNGDNKIKCFHNMTNSTWSARVIMPLEVFGFLVPLGTVAFCSFRTIHILLHCQSYAQSWAHRKASIWTIRANLAVFVVSFLPVHLAFFLRFLMEYKNVFKEQETIDNIRFFLQLSLCLSNTNCCLDVFCYYFVMKEFRASLPTRRTSSWSTTWSTRASGKQKEAPPPHPRSNTPS
ncbi:PREDICTED: G-protein coupled receptor 55 [Condylura cristata]|uniref:G-protein coupled receptor 55 n=1 Tax=Condylura cristata TaxID=143302 RepID=UPI0003346968|nr:PREDICTED: G-protein coupled receptor 55 [Condylura cristata]